LNRSEKRLPRGASLRIERIGTHFGQSTCGRTDRFQFRIPRSGLRIL